MDGTKGARQTRRVASSMDLISIAADLRRCAGQDRPAFSTRAIIRSALPLALVTGRFLQPGVNEIAANTNEGPVIIYSRNIGAVHRRHAIAHGLAHLLFDDDPDSACRPGFAGDPAVEARADLFADELLVPLAVLRPFIAHWPQSISDGPDYEIYLDQVDEIGSIFQAPNHVIERRIRLLIPRAEIS
jgi:hypothetical protein